MVWKVEFSPVAEKQFSKLDRAVQRRIRSFIMDRMEQENPRLLGQALHGELGEFWKYRVGDYRLVCELIDSRLVVLVVKIGNRKQVYR